MAYRPSNQPKSSQPKSKPEKPDQRWDFGYDNPVTPDGGVLKHKDVSSGSKLRPRDPDPKPPSCPTTDHNITITVESFDEKRKICQSPNTSLEEIGTRCYTRNTTGCSQGEGVNIYLIETGSYITSTRPPLTYKITAWAPGEGIHVAGPDYNGNPGVELATGASFAWPRVPGGPNIVWNGVEKDEWPGGIPHLPPPRPPGY
ncbi:hypothetical protein TWF788_006650 [Orbilia oligospora]|uniref:Uncharacterized protein n=1 Tax=Orbilia oligospora TaxID=2813651 RepID=A0A7C8TU81_ORBOL|nr:hypothetical protein TWF788_006650 [Orbilia oligospora]